MIKYNKTKIDNNLIISLTTIPSRSKYLLDTINSIMNQTILPRKIYIGIPYLSEREPLLKYKINNCIINNNIINIIYYKDDYGPIMKLITGLDQANNTDYIITIDDDIIYEKHLVEELIKDSIYSNTVNCSIGRDIYGIKKYGNDKIHFLTTLEGYGGVLYKRNLFDSNLIDIIKYLPYYIRTNDDLFISYYLKKNFTSTYYN